MDRLPFQRKREVPVDIQPVAQPAPEPVPFNLPAKPKDQLSDAGDVLHYLEEKYGGKSDGWKEPDGTRVFRLDFGDDRITGRGKTALEAVQHLAKRLGEKL